MTEIESRQKAVEEALSWLGTPYHLSSCVKGVGVDCAQFVAAVYKAVGLMPDDEEVGVFSNDWFAHAKEDKYLLRLMRHSQKIAETKCYRTTKAEPGNVLLTKAANSKVYNHAGIVIAWPFIAHAIHPCVEKVSAISHPMWAFQQIAILSPWGKDD